MSEAGHFLIPRRLETDRLLLRTFVNDDWRALHEHFSRTRSAPATPSAAP
jgi:hypothetical protein